MAAAAERAARTQRVAWAARADLREAFGVGRVALEEAPDVEPLHEPEDAGVLEEGVLRDLDEEILGRGPAPHLAGGGACAVPEGVRVQAEHVAAGRDAAVQLDESSRRGIDERPGVIGAVRALEPGLLQRAHRSRPVVEGQRVHVRHGPLGRRTRTTIRRGPRP